MGDYFVLEDAEEAEKYFGELLLEPEIWGRSKDGKEMNYEYNWGVVATCEEKIYYMKMESRGGKSSGLSTARGIKIGDRFEKVMELYGQPYKREDKNSSFYLYFGRGEDSGVVKDIIFVINKSSQRVVTIHFEDDFFVNK